MSPGLAYTATNTAVPCCIGEGGRRRHQQSLTVIPLRCEYGGATRDPASLLLAASIGGRIQYILKRPSLELSLEFNHGTLLPPLESARRAK